MDFVSINVSTIIKILIRLLEMKNDYILATFSEDRKLDGPLVRLFVIDIHSFVFEGFVLPKSLKMSKEYFS